MNAWGKHRRGGAWPTSLDTGATRGAADRARERESVPVARKLNRAQRFLAHAVLLFLCLPFILPLFWMVSTSLKEDRQITASGTGGSVISVESLVPNPARWDNYAAAVRAMPAGTYLKNTLYLCAVTVVAAVASSAIVAYGFARMRFRGRDALFLLMIATMALPGQVTMIPVFAEFRFLGWYGTFLPLIVPAFTGSAFFIFLLRQFFRTIPEELAEAARIDGAGEWRIFRQLMLPLAKPALATCALFEFLTTWNDFFGPLVYLNDPDSYTLAYGLQQFISAYGGEFALMMAATSIFTLPIIVLFFLAQRTFIQGIATTGGKA